MATLIQNAKITHIDCKLSVEVIVIPEIAHLGASVCEFRIFWREVFVASEPAGAKTKLERRLVSTSFFHTSAVSMVRTDLQ